MTDRFFIRVFAARLLFAQGKNQAPTLQPIEVKILKLFKESDFAF